MSDLRAAFIEAAEQYPALIYTFTTEEGSRP